MGAKRRLRRRSSGETAVTVADVQERYRAPFVTSQSENSQNHVTQQLLRGLGKRKRGAC